MFEILCHLMYNHVLNSRLEFSGYFDIKCYFFLFPLQITFVEGIPISYCPFIHLDFVTLFALHGVGGVFSKNCFLNCLL